MKYKKLLKVCLIIICILLFTYIFMNITYAQQFDIDEYSGLSGPQSTVNNSGNLQNIGNIIVGIIRTIGSIACLLVFMILGIKYMLGSAEEKANYKETMIPYLVGASLVFGITNLLPIIISLASQI